MTKLRKQSKNQKEITCQVCKHGCPTINSNPCSCKCHKSIKEEWVIGYYRKVGEFTYEFDGSLGNVIEFFLSTEREKTEYLLKTFVWDMGLSISKNRQKLNKFVLARETNIHKLVKPNSP